MGKPRPSPAVSAAAAQRDSANRGPAPGRAGPRVPPALRFVGLFGFLILAFYFISITPWFERGVLLPYLRWNAAATAAVLRALGTEASVKDCTVITARFPLEIRRGCDAIEPSGLYIATVLAFPAAWRLKLLGVLAGTLLLAALNLVRIVSLYYIGAHWPKLFDMMHADVWQAFFIFLALLFFLIWAWWARPRADQPPPPPDARHVAA